MLINMKEMLAVANKNHFAVGAFNATESSLFRSVVEEAEAQDAQAQQLVHHQRHPRAGQGGEDLGPVGVEAAGIVMGMGIKNGHGRHLASVMVGLFYHVLKK